MKGKYLFLIAILLVSLISCSKKIIPASARIDAVNPDLSPDIFRFDSLPESEINIPIQINLKPMYEMADKGVDTVFNSPGYPDKWVQDGCDVRYKYEFRRSPMQISGAGNSLNIGFTGYYKIIGSTRLCVRGTAISPWTPACKCGFGGEGERRVDVSFSNSLNVMPDYKIKLLVKRNEPTPLDKCEVCFWGQDITKQVLSGLTKELDASKKEMEKEYGSVDLKPYFVQVWDKLNTSYNLYNLGWLQVNPQKFRVNNLYINNDSLNVYLGLTAKPVISFEMPAERTTKMPNLGSFSRQQGFSIYLDAILNYDSLSKIMNDQARGKEFKFKKGFIKKNFVIEDCSVYGGGHDKMVIKVRFSGTNDGVVFLTGKPVYDAEKQILGIAEVDFDIKSKNILLGSADWLFDKKITNEIMKYSRFDLKDYIDSAKISLNEQLNQEWMKGINSIGNIREINLVGIYPLQKHLVIRSNCTGDLSVKVSSIDFSL